MHKIKLIYTWLVHAFMFLLPDVPIIMRLRGFFYSLAMKKCGRNFQVCHSTLLNTLEMISVGNNVYIANYSSLLANGEIIIGDNVLIGPNVVVSSGNHIVQNGVLLKESSKRAVLIGDNCWISANCTIVGGGQIPAGTILAAGAVWVGAVKNPEPDCIYGGVPARIIKKK